MNWKNIIKNSAPGKRIGRDLKYRKEDGLIVPFTDKTPKEARESMKEKRKQSYEKKFKPKCQNDPCLRIANGTDGYGLCMPCEDDMSGNRLTDPKSPYTRKNQMKNPTLPNIYVGDKR